MFARNPVLSFLWHSDSSLCAFVARVLIPQLHLVIVRIPFQQNLPRLGALRVGCFPSPYGLG